MFLTIAVIVTMFGALGCLMLAAGAAASARKWRRIAEDERLASTGLSQIVVAQEHVLAQIACGATDDPAELAVGMLRMTMTQSGSYGSVFALTGRGIEH